jgi:hypothetical protein
MRYQVIYRPSFQGLKCRGFSRAMTQKRRWTLWFRAPMIQINKGRNDATYWHSSVPFRPSLQTMEGEGYSLGAHLSCGIDLCRECAIHVVRRRRMKTILYRHPNIDRVHLALFSLAFAHLLGTPAPWTCESILHDR